MKKLALLFLVFGLCTVQAQDKKEQKKAPVP